MRGLYREVENRLIGEEWRLRDPRNAWNERRRSCRDHEATRVDGEFVVDRDGREIGKPRGSGNHAHTKPGEALDGIIRREHRNSVADVFGDGREIHLGRAGPHAESASTSDVGNVAGGRGARLSPAPTRAGGGAPPPAP